MSLVLFANLCLATGTQPPDQKPSFATDHLATKDMVVGETLQVEIAGSGIEAISRT
jgi:hypothetical protein